MKEIVVGIKVIIAKGEQILVIRRKEDKKDVFSGLWDIPGGKLQYGESYEEAIERIVEEKTGVNVGGFFPLSLWTADGIEPKQEVAGITVVAKYRSGGVTLSDKNVEFKWIFSDRFNDLKSYENLRAEIEKYAVM